MIIIIMIYKVHCSIYDNQYKLSIDELFTLNQTSSWFIKYKPIQDVLAQTSQHEIQEHNSQYNPCPFGQDTMIHYSIIMPCLYVHYYTIRLSTTRRVISIIIINIPTHWSRGYTYLPSYHYYISRWLRRPTFCIQGKVTKSHIHSFVQRFFLCFQITISAALQNCLSISMMGLFGNFHKDHFRIIQRNLAERANLAPGLLLCIRASILNVVMICPNKTVVFQ